jgi:hypothetical protein
MLTVIQREDSVAKGQHMLRQDNSESALLHPGTRKNRGFAESVFRPDYPEKTAFSLRNTSFRSMSARLLALAVQL